MIVSIESCVYLKHFNVIYHIKCLSIKFRLCKTILTIRHKSKLRRDRAISLGVRDNQPSVTTTISRSNNRFYLFKRYYHNHSTTSFVSK